MDSKAIQRAARAGTLLGKFATLVKDTLGLDPPEHDVPDLQAYIAKLDAENRAGEENGIRQSFTKPYTPKTNGKAERFIQTLKRRWAYRYVFRSSAMRAASLRP